MSDLGLLFHLLINDLGSLARWGLEFGNSCGLELSSANTLGKEHIKLSIGPTKLFQRGP